MTEADAKTKQCPLFACAAMIAVAAARPEDTLEVVSLCIGSGCMMWRWDRTPNPKYSGFDFTSNEPRYISDSEGYCGLAR